MRSARTLFEPLEVRTLLSSAVAPVISALEEGSTVAILAEAAPATPGEVRAERIAPRAARIAWADVAGETSYRVERRLDGSEEPWVAVARPAANVTSAVNEGLLLGRTYLFRVVAVNELGESAPSEPVSVTTPNESELPVVPTGVDATLVGPRAIRVTWNDVPNETSYVIERRIDGTTAPWAPVGDTAANVTTFTQDGLLPGKTYIYRVRSRNALGTSVPSVTDYATTPPEDGTTVPPAPTGLDAVLASPRAVRLRWTDVAGETSYVIERRVDGTDAPWAVVGDTAADVTTWGQDGLLAGRTYLYRVRARNAAGVSEPSNVDSVTTAPEETIPSAPRELDAVLVAPRAVRLTWADVAGERGYRIERRVDGSTEEWMQAGIVGENVTSFAQDGLLPGKTYLYRVRAFNGAGVSEPSNVDSVTTPGEPVEVPPAPTGLEATLVEGRVARLQWADVAGEAGYLIERRVDGSAAEWARAGAVNAGVTTFSDDGLLPGTTYLYRVRAFNAAGTSAPSNVASVTTPGDVGVPAAPRLAAGLAAPRAVRLAWTNVSNETGYKLERRVDGTDGPWVQIATTADEVTRYVDEGLEPGKTYLYRVRAFNASGDSAYSNTVYARVPREVAVPAAPTELRATLVEGRVVRLAWNDVAEERGYKVERRLDGSTEEWRQVGATAANVTTFSDDGLLPGRTYLYRVRAYNEAGNSAPSNTAAVATPGDPGVPASPRIEAAVLSPRAVRVAWRDVEGEQGYKVERRTDGTDGPWTQIGTTGANVTQYVDEGLDAGTTYLYRVRAFNDAGDSAYSNVAYARTAGEGDAPAAPTGLRATAVSPTVIELRWNDVGNERGYRVERRLDGSSAWQQVGVTEADVTAFRDAAAMPRRTYIYRVRAFNASGASPYSNTAVATTPRAEVSVGTGNGLLGTYFDNADLTDPKLRRLDPSVNFEWGERSPSPVIDANTFSVRWTGRVQAQVTETYRFYTQSDDGVRLWVNGQLLVDDWTHHARAERSGTVSLRAGELYDLRLEYFENNGQAVARLLWSSPSTAKQVIPRAQLYAGPDKPPAAAPAPVAAPAPTVASVRAARELLARGASGSVL